MDLNHKMHMFSLHYSLLFAVVWSFFSCMTAYVTFRASRRPLAKGVPQMVYRWFLIVYKVCFSMACVGYVVIMLDVFGLALILGDSVRLS